MSMVLEGPLAELADGKREGCPIEAALTAIGNRTDFLVLREAFYGTRRFDTFAERIGVTDASAAAHLRSLTDAGLLERVPYQDEGQRARFEYHLTEKGADLLPVMLSLLGWTEKHLWGGQSAFEVVETATTFPVHVTVTGSSGQQLRADELTVRPRSR
jgi:DNA-binding HxlR family transcriptional regulator